MTGPRKITQSHCETFAISNVKFRDRDGAFGDSCRIGYRRSRGWKSSERTCAALSFDDAPAIDRESFLAIAG